MTKYGWRANSINTKKLIVKGKMPVQYVIPKTVATSTVAILEAQNPHTSTTALTNTTILVQPPYPMVLTVNMKVAGTAGHYDNIEFKGYDAKGNSVRELVYITATAATTSYSNNAFARITSVKATNTLTAHAVLKSTDINIGYCAERIGLPYQIAGTTDILQYQMGGTCATTAWGGGASALSVNKTYDVLTLPSVTAGKVCSITFLSKVQE